MGDQEVLGTRLPQHHQAQDSADPRPQLLLITDHARYPGEAFFDVVEAALAGGVDAVLAREKQMDSARLLSFCSRLRGMTRRHGSRLFVHTQADVAMAVAADGVHMATADIGEIGFMRRWLRGSHMSISASCHDAVELQAAASAGADFALLSPVFPTSSHPGSPHLGVAQFESLAAQAVLPVVALGGITLENRVQLAAWPVAVIGAILQADDPQLMARCLRAAIAPDD